MKQLFLTAALLVALASPAGAQDTAAAATPPQGSDSEIAAPADAADEAEQTAEASAEPQPEEPRLLVIPASETDLENFLWLKRPVVVFADTEADPRFREQMELLLARPGPLIERDVVVITDTDPAARSSVRQKLRPRGFQLTLIGKDGKVNLRKPFPWDVREITRAIDKWPLRQQEIREAKEKALSSDG